MSKDLETISVLDDYLIVDTTDRRVCEISNPAYDRMFRGSRFANEMATLLVEYRNRIAELEEQLKNAIVPKFKVGDYFIEYWNKEPSIYQYQGDNHFKCLNKKQGYHCDYVILGALLLKEDFIEPISKKEAQAKLLELQGEKR